MTLNISFNKIIFVNKPPLFNIKGFTIWKAWMKIFLDAIDFNLWDYNIDGPFVPTRSLITKYWTNQVIYEHIRKEKSETKS